MTDKNGKPVTVGARCRFFSQTRKAWLNGTVRVVPTMGAALGTARVDDGDPANDDLDTNGFHVTSWVEREDIEVVEAGVACDDGTKRWTAGDERAAVVAWLRRVGHPCCHQCNDELAADIERGDHRMQERT